MQKAVASDAAMPAATDAVLPVLISLTQRYCT